MVSSAIAQEGGEIKPSKKEKTPMSVRAKFRCATIAHIHSEYPNNTCAEVKLFPVYADSPENKTWSMATPSGEIMLRITNPAAVEQFSPGKDYFIDFTPA